MPSSSLLKASKLQIASKSRTAQIHKEPCLFFHPQCLFFQPQCLSSSIALDVADKKIDATSKQTKDVDRHCDLLHAQMVLCFFQPP
jgi:hypothetical protein